MIRLSSFIVLGSRSRWLGWSQECLCIKGEREILTHSLLPGGDTRPIYIPRRRRRRRHFIDLTNRDELCEKTSNAFNLIFLAPHHHYHGPTTASPSPPSPTTTNDQNTCPHSQYRNRLSFTYCNNLDNDRSLR